MKMSTLAASAAALTLAGCLCRPTFNPDVNSAVSPDGRNEIRLYSNPLAYEVVRDGVVVVAKTEIGLKMNGKCVKEGVEKADSAAHLAVKGVFADTPVYKKGKISLAENKTFVDFGDWGVRLAARNDGVAYRFETKKPGIVDCEKADITLPKGVRCWFNRTGRGSLGCEETVPSLRMRPLSRPIPGRRSTSRSSTLPGSMARLSRSLTQVCTTIRSGTLATSSRRRAARSSSRFSRSIRRRPSASADGARKPGSRRAAVG